MAKQGKTSRVIQPRRGSTKEIQDSKAPSNKDFVMPKEHSYNENTSSENQNSVNLISDAQISEVSRSKKIKHTFSETLTEVLQAIRDHQTIDNINIRERIKDPDFRFDTLLNPELSLLVSETIAVAVKDSKESHPNVMSRLAIEKRNENADDFARRMFNVVKNLQEKENLTSYRETVKALNEQNIPSFRGGDWHLKTYQALNKRWKELHLLKK